MSLIHSNFYDEHITYSLAIGNETFNQTRPHISYCKDEKHLHYDPIKTYKVHCSNEELYTSLINGQLIDQDTYKYVQGKEYSIFAILDISDPSKIDQVYISLLTIDGIAINNRNTSQYISTSYKIDKLSGQLQVKIDLLPTINGDANFVLLVSYKV